MTVRVKHQRGNVASRYLEAISSCAPQTLDDVTAPASQATTPATTPVTAAAAAAGAAAVVKSPPKWKKPLALSEPPSEVTSSSATAPTEADQSSIPWGTVSKRSVAGQNNSLNQHGSQKQPVTHYTMPTPLSKPYSLSHSGKQTIKNQLTISVQKRNDQIEMCVEDDDESALGSCSSHSRESAMPPRSEAQHSSIEESFKTIHNSLQHAMNVKRTSPTRMQLRQRQQHRRRLQQQRQEQLKVEEQEEQNRRQTERFTRQESLKAWSNNGQQSKNENELSNLPHQPTQQEQQHQGQQQQQQQQQQQPQQQPHKPTFTIQSNDKFENNKIPQAAAIEPNIANKRQPVQRRRRDAGSWIHPKSPERKLPTTRDGHPMFPTIPPARINPPPKRSPNNLSSKAPPNSNGTEGTPNELKNDCSSEKLQQQLDGMSDVAGAPTEVTTNRFSRLLSVYGGPATGVNKLGARLSGERSGPRLKSLVDDISNESESTAENSKRLSQERLLDQLPLPANQHPGTMRGVSLMDVNPSSSMSVPNSPVGSARISLQSRSNSFDQPKNWNSISPLLKWPNVSDQTKSSEEEDLLPAPSTTTATTKSVFGGKPVGGMITKQPQRNMIMRGLQHRRQVATQKLNNTDNGDDNNNNKKIPGRKSDQEMSQTSKRIDANTILSSNILWQAATENGPAQQGQDIPDISQSSQSRDVDSTTQPYGNAPENHFIVFPATDGKPQYMPRQSTMSDESGWTPIPLSEPTDQKSETNPRKSPIMAIFSNDRLDISAENSSPIRKFTTQPKRTNSMKQASPPSRLSLPGNNPTPVRSKSLTNVRPHFRMQSNNNNDNNVKEATSPDPIICHGQAKSLESAQEQTNLPKISAESTVKPVQQRNPIRRRAVLNTWPPRAEEENQNQEVVEATEQQMKSGESVQGNKEKQQSSSIQTATHPDSQRTHSGRGTLERSNSAKVSKPTRPAGIPRRSVSVQAKIQAFNQHRKSFQSGGREAINGANVTNKSERGVPVNFSRNGSPTSREMLVMGAHLARLSNDNPQEEKKADDVSVDVKSIRSTFETNKQSEYDDAYDDDTASVRSLREIFEPSQNGDESRDSEVRRMREKFEKKKNAHPTKSFQDGNSSLKDVFDKFERASSKPPPNIWTKSKSKKTTKGKSKLDNKKDSSDSEIKISDKLELDLSAISHDDDDDPPAFLDIDDATVLTEETGLQEERDVAMDKQERKTPAGAASGQNKSIKDMHGISNEDATSRQNISRNNYIQKDAPPQSQKTIKPSVNNSPGRGAEPEGRRLVVPEPKEQYPDTRQVNPRAAIGNNSGFAATSKTSSFQAVGRMRQSMTIQGDNNTNRAEKRGNVVPERISKWVSRRIEAQGPLSAADAANQNDTEDKLSSYDMTPVSPDIVKHDFEDKQPPHDQTQATIELTRSGSQSEEDNYGDQFDPAFGKSCHASQPDPTAGQSHIGHGFVEPRIPNNASQNTSHGSSRGRSPRDRQGSRATEIFRSSLTSDFANDGQTHQAQAEGQRSRESTFSDGVTLDVSIEDVSGVTNPTAIRSKSSKEVSTLSSSRGSDDALLTDSERRDSDSSYHVETPLMGSPLRSAHGGITRRKRARMENQTRLSDVDEGNGWDMEPLDTSNMSNTYRDDGNNQSFHYVQQFQHHPTSPGPSTSLSVYNNNMDMRDHVDNPSSTIRSPSRQSMLSTSHPTTPTSRTSRQTSTSKPGLAGNQPGTPTRSQQMSQPGTPQRHPPNTHSMSSAYTPNQRSREYVSPGRSPGSQHSRPVDTMSYHPSAAGTMQPPPPSLDSYELSHSQQQTNPAYRMSGISLCPKNDPHNQPALYPYFPPSDGNNQHFASSSGPNFLVDQHQDQYHHNYHPQQDQSQQQDIQQFHSRQPLHVTSNQGYGLDNSDGQYVRRSMALSRNNTPSFHHRPIQQQGRFRHNNLTDSQTYSGGTRAHISVAASRPSSNPSARARLPTSPQRSVRSGVSTASLTSSSASGFFVRTHPNGQQQQQTSSILKKRTTPYSRLTPPEPLFGGHNPGSETAMSNHTPVTSSSSSAASRQQPQQPRTKRSNPPVTSSVGQSLFERVSARFGLGGQQSSRSKHASLVARLKQVKENRIRRNTGTSVERRTDTTTSTTTRRATNNNTTNNDNLPPAAAAATMTIAARTSNNSAATSVTSNNSNLHKQKPPLLPPSSLSSRLSAATKTKTTTAPPYGNSNGLPSPYFPRTANAPVRGINNNNNNSHLEDDYSASTKSSTKFGGQKFDAMLEVE